MIQVRFLYLLSPEAHCLIVEQPEEVIMRVFTLRAQQFIPRPIDEVFAFFEKPANLGEITPGDMEFRILTPLPFTIQQGRIIDYVIHLFGLPMHWRTLITEYEPPYRFVDEQLKGPYIMWHHTHSFKPVEGGTLMRDEVRYVMPFGFLGEWVQRLFVRRQVKKIFEYRKKVLQQRFGG